ncbi:hypothetical protein [Nocardia sp. NPDC052112]
MWADDCLLEDAESGPVTSPGADDLLDVPTARVHGVEFDARMLLKPE